jgi:hypothetical protein
MTVISFRPQVLPVLYKVTVKYKRNISGSIPKREVLILISENNKFLEKLIAYFPFHYTESIIQGGRTPLCMRKPVNQTTIHSTNSISIESKCTKKT